MRGHRLKLAVTYSATGVIIMILIYMAISLANKSIIITNWTDDARYGFSFIVFIIPAIATAIVAGQYIYYLEENKD